MDLCQVVRLINREPKSFVGAFILDSTPKRAIEMQREAVELLGFDSARALQREYPSLKSNSIQSYMDHSFQPIVEGDQKSGYRLVEENASKIFIAALRYSISTSISMYNIFTTDSGAQTVLNILQAAEQQDGQRISDIHTQTGTSISSITDHFLRLQDIGLVQLERYEEGVLFSSTNVNNSSDHETRIGEHFSNPNGAAHKTRRAIAILEYLRRVERPVSAREVSEHLPYTNSGSNLANNEYMLRVLIDLSYVQPTNDFRGGVRQSSVTLNGFGKGFCGFLDRLENDCTLPDDDLSLEEATRSLDTYNKANPTRRNENTRLNEIKHIIGETPGLTQDEINTQLGVLGNEYLSTLQRRGVIHTEGSGVVNNRLRYFLTPTD